jgi:hypothetical protein
MSTGVLWPSFFTGDGTRIRKWLYGSVLARDWDPAGSTEMSDIVVFTTDGNLNPALLTPTGSGGYGFFDVGNITENGVEFNPQFSVDETYVWQSRRTQRTDITKDDEEVMFSCSDSTPLVDYLYLNLPIGFNGVPLFPQLGSSNYSVTKPFYSDVVYRQLLIIGVDGSMGPNGAPEYIVELRPRVSLAKKNKRQWGSKQIDVHELTYTVHMDPFSGFDSKTLRGGSVWVSEGTEVFLPTQPIVTATAGTTGLASIVFNQPINAAPSPTYIYTVTVSRDGGVTYSSAAGSAATSGGVVTYSATGLTAGASIFKVTAHISGSNTVTYPVSNSATIT